MSEFPLDQLEVEAIYIMREVAASVSVRLCCIPSARTVQLCCIWLKTFYPEAAIPVPAYHLEVQGND